MIIIGSKYIKWKAVIEECLEHPLWQMYIQIRWYFQND